MDYAIYSILSGLTIMVFSRVSAPFRAEHQLTFDIDQNQKLGSARAAYHLPGYPHILLDDQHGLWGFLDEEFCSSDLNKIADKLWWMAKQDSASVAPLHRQRVKRRSIIITEEPKLHLIWIQDRIFVKPLPRYILSHAFWQRFLACDSTQITPQGHRIRQTILGYLRTYRHLIRYESDFRIAQEPGLQLIPSDVTWEQFCHFRADLASISDDEVSTRYRYGEIRLTRLNFYAPLLLGKSYFQRIEYQYGAYFARFYGPILFFLGVVSVVLSGLQVAVAVDDSSNAAQQSLPLFAYGFSVAMMVLCCVLIVLLASLLVCKVVREWKFAIGDRIRLLRETRRAKTSPV